MPHDNTAARRLAAHLVRLEAKATEIEVELAALAAQATAELPPPFDEAAARTEIAQAQAADIAAGTDAAPAFVRAVAQRRAVIVAGQFMSGGWHWRTA